MAGLFQDVVDGIVKGISVGYEIYKFEREERPNGARPIYRATDWMPIEISLAPVPADIDSGIRTGQQQHPVEIINKRITNTTTNMKKTRATETGKTMEYVVEGDPVKQGDIVTVDGVKGVALSDGEVGDTITLTPVSYTHLQVGGAARPVLARFGRADRRQKPVFVRPLRHRDPVERS